MRGWCKGSGHAWGVRRLRVDGNRGHITKSTKPRAHQAHQSLYRTRGDSRITGRMHDWWCAGIAGSSWVIACGLGVGGDTACASLRRPLPNRGPDPAKTQNEFRSV